MDDQVTPALAQSSAARAFDDLRGEVSLLRRAIEGLTAERRDQPDYGPTLEALAASNEELRAWAKKVSERPALQLTPQQIGEQIEAAASRFRQLDRQELGTEHARLTDAIAAVRVISRNAQTNDEQLRRVKIVGGTCFLGGFMLALLLMLLTSSGKQPTEAAERASAAHSISADRSNPSEVGRPPIAIKTPPS